MTQTHRQVNNPIYLVSRRNRSPGPMMQQWDRRDYPPRGEMHLQTGEKPQGIPVIGGGPRPIPTNVTASRPTPPHRHPDMLPPSSQAVMGVDYLPPDIVKLPPNFPPVGYHPDGIGQHRDPGMSLPPMPPGVHQMQRMGVPPGPPTMPMVINPMHEPRMHPMDYEMRQRFGM